MSFVAVDLGYEYGLNSVAFELPERGLVAIAGPNGAGKSTLLGILAGLRRPYKGSVRFEGHELRDWSRGGFARRVAFVPQSLRVEFPFTAEEVVLMGRAPYSQGWFESKQDHDVAVAAMETTDALQFRTRDFRSLSGGERQRVILAAALAQRPATLLLDEPATFLDIKHQLALYRLLAQQAERMLVATVTHDLNLALQFADHALVLDAGRLAAEGPPAKVFTSTLIGQVFGVRVHRSRNAHGRVWMNYEA